MTLSQLPLRKPARVVHIEGGHGLRRNLNRMGIHDGDVVSLARRGAFCGPLLVLVHGMQVALGRGLASQMHVEPIGVDGGKRDTHE